MSSVSKIECSFPIPGLTVRGPQFENNCLTELCSGTEGGSCSRRIDFACHSTLGLRVITQRSRVWGLRFRGEGLGFIERFLPVKDTLERDGVWFSIFGFRVSE